MTFRLNFIIESVAALSWMMANLGFYLLIFTFTDSIGENTGWGQYEFFIFLATTMFVNSLVQAFFMPNAQEFSELIRTGRLDFALLKPIDTQFLISLQRVNWASLINFLAGGILLAISLSQLSQREEKPFQLTLMIIILYPIFIACGVAILYSLMVSLAATSIWLGRNQSLYDFWFYITNFSRYPKEIYSGTFGWPLRWFFTFIVPVLIVVNVPARIMAQPLRPDTSLGLAMGVFAVVATVLCLIASRFIFRWSLLSYRSASS
jgi:ABC-2 type transport system permease protein